MVDHGRLFRLPVVVLLLAGLSMGVGLLDPPRCVNQCKLQHVPGGGCVGITPTYTTIGEPEEGECYCDAQNACKEEKDCKRNRTVSFSNTAGGGTHLMYREPGGSGSWSEYGEGEELSLYLAACGQTKSIDIGLANQGQSTPACWYNITDKCTDCAGACP